MSKLSTSFITLILTASVFGALPAGIAFGQSVSATADSGAQLEEVVVNARRVEENLQDVPISVAVLSPTVIRNLDITNGFELTQKALPDVTICCSPVFTAGTATSVNAWVRGVHGFVAYLSDVPVSLNGGAAYFDLDNLQFLKGPQGTLFGLSTDGGALLLQPKKPSNDLEGYVNLTLGDFNHEVVEGMFNVPLIDDKFMIRFGGRITRTDGYVYDPTSNVELGSEFSHIARLVATMRPTDSLENTLLFNYWDDKTTGYPYVLTSVNPTGLMTTLFGAPAVNALLAQQQANGLYRLNGSFDTTPQLSPLLEYEQWNTIDTLKWDLNPNLSVKNIFGYQSAWSIINGGGGYGVANGDGLPLKFNPANILTAPDGSTFTNGKSGVAYQTTEEIQLLGKAFSDKLTYVVGSFNEWTGIHNPNNPQYFAALITGNTTASTTTESGNTKAVYGQGTYDLSQLITEGLKFTAGYRYSWDQREDTTNALDPASGALISSVHNQGTFHSPSYDLSLTYNINPRTMVYFTDSKGYSSGGFNTSPGLPTDLQSYGPENLDNFEVGVKSDFDVGAVKFRTNAAVFYGKYDNIQVQVVAAHTSTVTGTTTLFSVIQSVADGIIRGFDGDFTVIPASWLELGASVAYVDAYYTHYLSNGTDLSAERFNGNPPWKYTLNSTVYIPINASLGKLSASAYWSWQDKWPAIGALSVAQQDYDPIVENLDLVANWADFVGYKGLDGSIGVSNVTNRTSTSSPFPTYASLGFSGIQPAPPKMWRVSLRYRF